MNLSDKITQLKSEIISKVAGSIDRDYVLLGLPYYMNIGDLLIWQGELDFLKRMPHRCLNRGFRYSDESRITPDTLILLQGGGNFGDLWRPFQEERLGLIQRYPRNPILIFPVTCWYDDAEMAHRDAEIMARHPNLTICVRDEVSYEFMKKLFSNTLLLVPDMAFCVDRDKWARQIKKRGDGTLFLKRTDKELKSHYVVTELETAGDIDVRDWPSFGRNPHCWTFYKLMRRLGNFFKRYTGPAGQWVLKLSDWYYHEYCRERLIREGVSFVGRYQNIISTRLHVAILSILLNKKVKIADNSYGKNSSFYKTWLADADGVILLP